MRTRLAWALLVLGGCGSNIYVPDPPAGSPDPQSQSGVSAYLRSACSIDGVAMADDEIIGHVQEAEMALQEGWTKDQIQHNLIVGCTYVCQVECYEANGGNCPGDEDSQCHSFCDDCVKAIIREVFH